MGKLFFGQLDCFTFGAFYQFKSCRRLQTFCDAVYGNRLILPFDDDSFPSFDDHAGHLLVRSCREKRPNSILGQKNRYVISSGQLLHARAEVDLIADYGVVHLLAFGANVSDEDKTGINADAGI